MTSLSIPVHVVDRRTIMAMFDLSPAFVERWLARGVGEIPQMPHFPGKPARFHVGQVEDWYLKHFQRGGEPRRK